MKYQKYIFLFVALFVSFAPMITHADCQSATAAANAICIAAPGTEACLGAQAALAAECGGAGGGWGSFGLPAGSIYGILATTMNWLLAILGFIGIIAFVIAGIMYLISAGDDDMAERAKNAMKYAVIGIIVALMGFVIIQAVDLWLSASSTTF